MKTGELKQEIKSIPSYANIVVKDIQGNEYVLDNAVEVEDVDAEESVLYFHILPK